MPIYQPHDGECGLLRWDDVYIQPASRTGEQAFVAISDQLRTTEPVTIHLINAGDTLIVDNWRMIHGRSPAAHSAPVSPAGGHARSGVFGCGKA